MLYILYGSDTLSRREALRRIRSELDADGMLDTNTTVMDARQTTPAEVFAACDTAPFMGAHRLVVIEGALTQAPGAGRGRRPRSSEAESGRERGAWWALADYAARMPEQTVLVLIDGESVDRDLVEALGPLARVQKTSLPGQKDVRGWVQARARSHGVNIDGAACALLAERAGNDTWLLASELDKLAAFAAGAPIREADVRALVTDVRDREGYLLADAVADGRPAVATRLLHDLLAKGRPPPVLLLTIENRYRRIAIAREMTDAGASGSSIATRLRIENPYALERLLDQVARYSMAGARRALDRIAQADYDVKQGLCDEELSLELLVHDLASVNTASRAA